ncbi:hypothetical protein [Shewanella surugensis]|uniref:Secreted protein n=1 Tax=Shewanella surugensis TaxID=212020 RepID=A0ABT0LCA9_9GAMM|nr:hypothetical protein [Shewanella surugensis]MCL1125285.1 hypothetical protein [Shewanella surugensis]
MCQTFSLKALFLLIFTVLLTQVVNAFPETNIPKDTQVTVFNNTDQKMIVSFLAHGCTNLTIAVTRNKTIKHNNPNQSPHLWYRHPRAENPYRHCQVNILQPNQLTFYRYKGVGYLIETERFVVSYTLKENNHESIRNMIYHNYVYLENTKNSLPISARKSSDTYLSITQTNPSDKLTTALIQISP